MGNWKCYLVGFLCTTAATAAYLIYNDKKQEKKDEPNEERASDDILDQVKVLQEEIGHIISMVIEQNARNREHIKKLEDLVKLVYTTTETLERADHKKLKGEVQ